MSRLTQSARPRQEGPRQDGPKPGRPAKPVVLVGDNGPIHVSKLPLAALAARSYWLTVEWLPKYAPELNDFELWRALKAHHLAHQIFTDVAAFDQVIHNAVHDLNQERMAVSLTKSRSFVSSPTAAATSGVSTGRGRNAPRRLLRRPDAR